MHRLVKRAATATAALVVASAAFAPTAFADPESDTAPAPPNPTADNVSTDSTPPLVSLPAPEGSILNVSVLPLNDKAHWLPVPNWGWGSPYLTGVEVCSPDGVPPAVSDTVPFAPSSDVQHVILAPGDNGNPQGWTATVSFAPYASISDSIAALHSYKVYLEHCPLVNTEAQVLNDGSVARNDPTIAHGVLVTYDHYIEVFAVAVNNGIVELALTRPTDIGQVSFPYSTRDVVASLRGAVVRPVVNRGPFG